MCNLQIWGKFYKKFTQFNWNKKIPYEYPTEEVVRSVDG